MTISQIQPDTPVFGSNTIFDQPSCNIKSPFSPGNVSPPDCLKAIDSIRINKASPQKLLKQSAGEISASFKTCFVYIKSSNQLDITLNQDKLKKMSSLINVW
ncbi:hypothetical protein PGT21_021127 [Puccinia graminis f. sp. tritici]|uniref:Uncharacterized protein n=1 Tax=Puccinia graminis f. sp. tritici TaxID=56615 RepID=A0A5B0N3A9_PUCGR|nr:hypothetical protein PGT21_021127 [Puccinia graminis f. sp. tritici]